MDWEALRRSEFPVAERWAYFDHAAVAPLPRRSGDVLRAWADEQERNGVVHWPDWERKLEATRGRIARLLNAEADEIAFVGSTTQGIGLVAEGFPWRVGDSVVTAAEEYPSNIYPWMNLASRGVGLRTVPSREGRVWVEDLAAAIDRTTRVLTISHVEFASGFRNDLDALAGLCRERGIALFVDAIQGLGPLTIDVKRTPIDFLAADGHKWLLGPEGAGLLFVRREWIERLRPLGVGWHSVVGVVQRARDRLHPQAERPALGGGQLQHAGPASLRRQPGAPDGARARGGLGPHPGARRARPRARHASAGWQRLRLGPAGRPLRDRRPGASRHGPGSRSPASSADAGSRWPVAAAGSASARTSTTTTTTSVASPRPCGRVPRRRGLVIRGRMR